MHRRKYTFGILHNGDILWLHIHKGQEVVEGNIRTTPLKTIWENPHSFSWNRNIKKEDLGGFCTKCRFGDRCLGGCSNTDLLRKAAFMLKPVCSYNHAVKEKIKLFQQIHPTEKLIAMGRNFAEKGYFQLAESALDVVLQRKDAGGDTDLLNLYGFVSFKLGNYQVALQANEQVLQREPDSVYALKGKGLCLYRLGNSEEGIKFKKSSIAYR
jgi:radical SAM protein with 4Fe4S-binding SPASM domain